MFLKSTYSFFLFFSFLFFLSFFLLWSGSGTSREIVSALNSRADGTSLLVIASSFFLVSPFVLTAVFDARPTLRACMAQGLFLGGTGRRTVAHTRPEFAKNALGPVGIPLVRGASGAGEMNPTPLERG